MFKINYLLQAVIIHSDAARAPLGHKYIWDCILGRMKRKSHAPPLMPRTVMLLYGINPLLVWETEKWSRSNHHNWLFATFFSHFKDPRCHGNSFGGVWLLVDLSLKWSIDRINYNWLPYPHIHIQIELLYSNSPVFFFGDINQIEVFVDCG